MKNRKALELVKKLGEKAAAGTISTASLGFIYQTSAPQNLKDVLKKHTSAK